MTSNDIKDAINQLAGDVYQNADNHGFHEEDANRSDVENYAIWMANIHGEVSELWEAARRGELEMTCDKGGAMINLFGYSLSNEEEELADIIIRALDTAVARGLDIGRAVMLKHNYNQTRSHKHGGKLA